jgi:hypothetical protein
MGDFAIADDRILRRSGQVLRRTKEQYLAVSLPGAFQTGKRALGDGRGRGYDQRRSDNDEFPHCFPLGRVLRCRTFASAAHAKQMIDACP